MAFEIPRSTVVVQFEVYHADLEVGLAVDIPTDATKSESSLWSDRPFILSVVSNSHAFAHALAPSNTTIS